MKERIKDALSVLVTILAIVMFWVYYLTLIFKF